MKIIITESRLKELIFKKLYQDLSNAEIIPHEDSIWFIDKENKYWYFEYQMSGTLWWRYGFFNSFFELFSLKMNEYESVISDWVEEVLNHKVKTTGSCNIVWVGRVEEVLNQNK